MKTLLCPHCGTQGPASATVCAGCGAEIVHGASRRERSAAGCVVTVIAVLIALVIAGMGSLPETSSDEAFFLVLKFIALVIVANAIGRLAIRWLRRSQLRFFRKRDFD